MWSYKLFSYLKKETLGKTNKQKCSTQLRKTYYLIHFFDTPINFDQLLYLV